MDMGPCVFVSVVIVVGGERIIIYIYVQPTAFAVLFLQS